MRTDREQLRVPKRHEEVHVERVPVAEGREASEEEVVVEKRSKVKEIRLSKTPVEEEALVEEDVRRGGG